MYLPQIEDLNHTLNDIVEVSDLYDDEIFPDLSDDLIKAVLTEAGRFASAVLAPLNRVGDEHGCKLDQKTADVTTAPGWKSAYQQWAQGGWASLPCRQEFGGQGLPLIVGLAAQEIWNTAASAFGIGTLLTQGAVNAIVSHGSPTLKATYLPKMVSGEWTGTMCLTESNAGSDLGALRAKAKPNGDGTYAISGTKIFITYGEHDLTENIIHLVLARLPDAPAGHRGISLFLVPKFLLDADGSIAKRNDVKCVGLEHKMGIHGSPTATLQFGDEGGATGWLVGQENRGLNCMFTMMNDARIHVGIQGVAIGELAYQQALAFAQERKQGTKAGVEGPVAIIEHADVRNMLLEMKSKVSAARAICYLCAKALVLGEHSKNEQIRAENADLGALLTPVAKAFSTDIGMEVASLGIQVHGGMGFIEETGAAQHLRDVRITQIYEGTNGIQAMDLVGRKLPLGNGKTVMTWLEDQQQIALSLDGGPLADVGTRLSKAIDMLTRATKIQLDRMSKKNDGAMAAATDYLRCFGLVAGCVAMAKGAQKSGEKKRINLVEYFARNQLTGVAGLLEAINDGASATINRENDPLV